MTGGDTWMTNMLRDSYITWLVRGSWLVTRGSFTRDMSQSCMTSRILYRKPTHACTHTHSLSPSLSLFHTHTHTQFCTHNSVPGPWLFSWRYSSNIVFWFWRGGVAVTPVTSPLPTRCSRPYRWESTRFFLQQTAPCSSAPPLQCTNAPNTHTQRTQTRHTAWRIAPYISDSWPYILKLFCKRAL